MMKKSLFLGLIFSVFFSATVAFAAAPTVSGLSTAFKNYVSLPKPIAIADLVIAYKNFIFSLPPAMPTP
ncbi:hypothetical protein A3A11_00130 [Candidatus Nomurabacteria bacterium RIFCSPLOWO2_01_FULL_43_15]|nr:MAG: hypothetical protein A3A11_00130 [Candidatus Nomurabacteria bacterium RIFCSPLOWO2_01_FULL_43_15]